MKHEGWILDLYPRPGHMVVWLKKKDGSAIRLADPWKPRISIGGEYRDLLDLADHPGIEKAHFVQKYEKAGDIAKSKVLEVEVENDAAATYLASKIQQADHESKYRFYNVDIPSAQIYLYEKNLFPLAYVEADSDGGNIRWTLKDSRETIDYQLPPFRTIRLEAKTQSTRRIRSFNDKLASIQITAENGETLTIDSDGEVEKILGLVETIRDQDPDIVLTDDGDSFLFPYLARLARQNGILDSLILGRDTSQLRISDIQGHSYFSYGKILYRDTAARLLGRLHVDQQNAFISADCGLEGLFEVSRTCIIPIQRASRATIGTNMTSLQFYEAVRRDILIPWNKNEPEEWKNGTELIIDDRGGFVYEPEPGIHDQVGELDFTSLYPTIMLQNNLSGETVQCPCCPNSTHIVPEQGYHICQRQTGIVPGSLEILLRKRTSYKKHKKETRDETMRERYNKRQAALKWILVCSFGYLGYKNARFGKIDAHIATCAYARTVLRKTAKIAEEHGFRLVHGIVDSLWLKKPDAATIDYENLSETISRELQLPISFEGQYRWIVFLNSKTNTRIPVLNRYYGILQDGTLKVRGIDLRRHDTPEIVRKCQEQMLALFSKATNSEEFRSLIPTSLKILARYAAMLRKGQIPLEDLVVEKNLSKDPDEYTNQVPQAIAAKHLLAHGGTIHPGQTMSYILAQDKLQTSESCALPPELVDETAQYDSEKYLRLLCSSVANLLLPFQYDQNRLTQMLHA